MINNKLFIEMLENYDQQSKLCLSFSIKFYIVAILMKVLIKCFEDKNILFFTEHDILIYFKGVSMICQFNLYPFFVYLLFTRMRLIVLLALLCLTIQILDRSYYDALELPVSSSQEDIRDAFRRLSRLYHPDRNPGNRQKFEKINVAYQTLYNQNKKFLYDRVGIEKMNDPNVYQQFDFNQLKGPELKIKVFLELKDFYLGKELDVLVEKQVACPHCKGTGAENPYDVVTCHDCSGQGRVTKRVELGGGYYNLYTQTCPRCQGKGKVIGRKCHLCSSQKIIPGVEQFTLKIKPGSASNSDLRYTNMGDERMQGAPSDIVFQLVEIEHPFLKRDGDHLRTEISITLQQAILGFSKNIKHLDGRQIVIQETGITQPGFVKVLEEQGMPIYNSNQKGNLYVKINVLIPNFDDQQLQELEQFFNKRKN